LRTRGILRLYITPDAAVSGAEKPRGEEDSSHIANLGTIGDTAIGIFRAITTDPGRDIEDIMAANTVTTDPCRKANAGIAPAVAGNV